MSLPPFCKHCRNLGLGRCLQVADRPVPNLHLNRWTFLRVIWKARKFVVGLEMPIGTKRLGMPMVRAAKTPPIVSISGI